MKTTGIRFDGNQNKCLPYNNWIGFVKFMTIADILLTMILPFLLIAIINMMIYLKLASIRYSVENIKKFLGRGVNKRHCNTNSHDSRVVSNIRLNTEGSTRKTNQANNFNDLLTIPTISHFNSNRQKLSKESHLTESGLMVTSFQSTLKNNSPIISRMNLSNFKLRSQSFTRTTKVLLSISTSFLVLHCPIAFCKIYSFFKIQYIDFMAENAVKYLNESSHVDFLQSLLFMNNTSNEENRFDDNYKADLLNVSYDSKFFEKRERIYFESVLVEHLIERLFNDLYYLNFLINLFLYNLNGSKFRKSLTKMFKGFF